MTQVFFISDTHFNHKLMVQTRQFASLEEHDETLIANWNKTVKKRDIVYHLGDVTFGKFEQLARLNGVIKVVLGNHDNERFLEPYIDRCYGALSYKTWILTHIPVHPNQLKHRWEFNIHGHLHHNIIDDLQYVNISSEQIGLTPISLEELKKRCC